MLTVTFYVRREFACPGQKLKKLVRAVCGRFGLKNARVSIAIVGNKQIRVMNDKFLHRKTVTDCLSFDLSENSSSHKWFELVVNGERAKSEAARRGHSAQAECNLQNKFDVSNAG
jgi:ssRNA-specific RNase YbeY (16S rRNA maturation enzyme)